MSIQSDWFKSIVDCAFTDAESMAVLAEALGKMRSGFF
jgi:hypothetical protein